MTATLKIPLSLEAGSRVLASFNPANILVSMARAGPTSRRVDLNKIEASVKAHELMHYLQMVGTANGVRLFGFWTDLLKLKLSLITLAAQYGEGKLKVPLLLHGSRELWEDTEYKQLLALYLKLLSRFSYHYGGFSVTVDIVKRCRALWPGILYVSDRFSWYFEIEEKLPIIVVNLSHLGINHATVLGARHIREGAAKAVEIIHGTFQHGQNILQRLPTLEVRHGLADPYYLCQMLFQSALGSTEHANLEEFLVLCDLSLMCDNWITNQPAVENVSENTRSEALKALEDIDVGPGYNFVHFLSVLTDSASILRPLKIGYTKDDLLEFAEEILRKAQAPLSLAQLTDRTLHYTEKILNPDMGLPYPREVYKFLREAFLKILTFRKETLKGGPILEDVLTSDSRLDLMYKALLPAFSVGHYIYSPCKVNGIPSGIHLQDLAQIQFITDLLVCGGDQACPLHKDQPRVCSIKETPSCTRLATIRDTLNLRHCVHQQTLAALMDMWQITELIVP